MGLRSSVSYLRYDYRNLGKFHMNIKLDETMLALLFEGFLAGSEQDKINKVTTLTKLMSEL